MNQSKLIALWYKEFCMKGRKPFISFETFSFLMKKYDFDIEESVRQFKLKFNS